MKLNKLVKATKGYVGKAMALLLLMLLTLGVVPMSMALANGDAPSTVDAALVSAQQAIDNIATVSIPNKQAAIDSAVSAVNAVVGEINQILAAAEGAVVIANQATADASAAADSVVLAAADAQAALVAAEANEAAFNTLFEGIVAAVTPQNYNATLALVNLENAVAAAWNAYATAQNAANALAEDAVEVANTLPQTADAAILLAEDAQAAATALLQAWLDAEANLAQAADGTLAALAVDRLQTRTAAAAAYSDAIEAALVAAEMLVDAQEAFVAATATKAQAQGQADAYIQQLNLLISELNQFDGQSHTITINCEYTFQVAPPASELPGPAYSTSISRLVFNPTAQWGGSDTCIFFNWDYLDPWLMIEARILVEGGTVQTNLGNPSNPANVGNTQNVAMSPGSQMVLTDANGLPRQITANEPNVRIMIEVVVWTCPDRILQATHRFWATGTLQNTGGGSFHINGLCDDMTPTQSTTTIELSVGNINTPMNIANLVTPEVVELELDDLFMVDPYNLTDPTQPPTLTGTVTCEDTGRPIPGVRVYLYDDEGNQIDYRVTDENGFFDFGEVPVGDLEVRIDVDTIPEGYVVTDGYNRTVTTVPGGVYEEDFFARPSSTVQYLRKTPDRTAVRIGEAINWTLRGFHNYTGETATDFTIVDIPGRGQNFVSGRLPAFTNGAGITFDIRYTVYGSNEWRNHATGVDAGQPFEFFLPQPGNVFYTNIGFFFGDVPADFGYGDQIILTFLVGHGAPNNVLVNRFVVMHGEYEREGNGTAIVTSDIIIPDVPVSGPTTETTYPSTPSAPFLPTIPRVVSQHESDAPTQPLTDASYQPDAPIQPDLYVQYPVTDVATQQPAVDEPVVGADYYVPASVYIPATVQESVHVQDTAARVNPQTSNSRTGTIAFVAFAALILSGAAYVLVSKKKKYN